MKKLMEAVKISIPVLAETMESLRESMIIFRYQLRHISVGKNRISEHIQAVKPELEQYAGLVQQIKGKTKERKNLLAEKKETPFYQIPKLHDLSTSISELTEELEELKSEKAMTLNMLDCADDVGISAIKKNIVTMESGLKKLEQQEEKYSAELVDALKQYEVLKEQATELDADELMEKRIDFRIDKERSAVSRVQAAYGEKYDPLMMYDSKRDVSELLGEKIVIRSIRERLRKKQHPVQQQKKVKHHEQER